MSIRGVNPGFLGFVCFVVGIEGLFGPKAHAFDPFTVLAAGNAAISIADYASGGANDSSDVRDLMSALGELDDELIPNHDDDPYKVAQKIAEAEHLAREAGYTKEEIDSLLLGYKTSNQNLTQSIRLLSRSVRMGKQIARLSGIVAAASEAGKAGVASEALRNQAQNQEKKILTDMYGQMLNSTLDEKIAELRRQKAFQERYKKLRSYVYSVAPGGNMALFPLDSKIIKKAMDVYHAYYAVLLALVGTIFMFRVIYYQFSLATSDIYVDLIKDVFTCYFLMLALPHVFTYLVECSEALSLKLGEVFNVTGAVIPDALPIDLSNPRSWLRLEVFPLVLYALTHIVFNFVIALLIAMGPIIVLGGTMMNFSVSLTAYFGLLLFICVWPAFWNVLGYFKNVLFDEKGAGDLFAGFIVFLFQAISPLFLYVQLKNTQVGQAASKALGGVGSGVSKGVDWYQSRGGEGAQGAQGGQGIRGGGGGGDSKPGVRDFLSSPGKSTKTLVSRMQRKRRGIDVSDKDYQEHFKL
ncbi:hypothetical protein WDW86_10170 [Bdellovibrionota bacterium FG-2]